MGRRRSPDPFDRRSAALSGAMHAMIVVLAWLSTFYAPEPIEFLTYEIELVSPPPAVQAEEPQEAAEELVVERPDPEPTLPEPEVEEIVPVGSLDPDLIHTPGVYVDRLVQTVSEKRIEQRTVRQREPGSSGEAVAQGGNV